MIPQDRLSTTNLFAPYLVPDGIEPSPILDYELGGIALNDTSEGLMYQVWTARLFNGINNISTVYISAANHPESVLFSGEGITEISLAFDQNMHPFIAFVENGVARFWWFDTEVGEQVFTDLPVDSTAPKACLDDKRIQHLENSDIILAYTRAGILYFRQQRDRYLIEYELLDPVVGSVLRVGMSRNLRLQFALGTMPDLVSFSFLRSTTAGRNRVTTQGYIRKLVGTGYA